GSAHRAQLQVERQERKPVAQRGDADRCGQYGEVTPAVRHQHEAADSTIVTTIGVLHPGEMGAAVAAALRSRGQDVVWASEGRGDANAVSPQTARAIGTAVETAGATFVDGGIVGSPPREPGTTRLYLSGPF